MRHCRVHACHRGGREALAEFRARSAGAAVALDLLIHRWEQLPFAAPPVSQRAGLAAAEAKEALLAAKAKAALPPEVVPEVWRRVPR